MLNDFLQPDYGTDESPLDMTRVNQIILYLNDEDTKEFKRLAKEAMKRYWPADYIEKANLSDLLLKMLRDAKNNT